MHTATQDIKKHLLMLSAGHKKRTAGERHASESHLSAWLYMSLLAQVKCQELECGLGQPEGLTA